jgi:hypothetical protein
MEGVFDILVSKGRFNRRIRPSWPGAGRFLEDQFDYEVRSQVNINLFALQGIMRQYSHG